MYCACASLRTSFSPLEELEPTADHCSFSTRRVLVSVVALKMQRSMRIVMLCVALVAACALRVSASSVDTEVDASSSLESSSELQSLLWQLEQAEQAHDETESMLMQVSEAAEMGDQSAESLESTLDLSAAAQELAEAQEEDQREIAAQAEEEQAELMEMEENNGQTRTQHTAHIVISADRSANAHCCSSSTVPLCVQCLSLVRTSRIGVSWMLPLCLSSPAGSMLSVVVSPMITAAWSVRMDDHSCRARWRDPSSSIRLRDDSVQRRLAMAWSATRASI